MRRVSKNPWDLRRPYYVAATALGAAAAAAVGVAAIAGRVLAPSLGFKRGASEVAGSLVEEQPAKRPRWL